MYGKCLTNLICIIIFENENRLSDGGSLHILNMEGLYLGNIVHLILQLDNTLHMFYLIVIRFYYVRIGRQNNIETSCQRQWEREMNAGNGECNFEYRLKWMTKYEVSIVKDIFQVLCLCKFQETEVGNRNGFIWLLKW